MTLKRIAPKQVRLDELGGERIEAVLTRAPGHNAPLCGVKVVAKSGWFAARPSGTESIHKIYVESFQGRERLRRLLMKAQRIIGDTLTPTKAPLRSPPPPPSALPERTA